MDSAEDGSDDLGCESPVQSLPTSEYLRTPEGGSCCQGYDSARMAKRMRKRALAREAAMVVCGVANPGTLCSDGFTAGSPVARSSERKTPERKMVMSPSTFFLYEFIPGKWITVQRRIRSSVVRGARRRRNSPAAVIGSHVDRRSASSSSSGLVDPGSNSNLGFQRSVDRLEPMLSGSPGRDRRNEVSTRVFDLPHVSSTAGAGLRRFLGFVWRKAVAD